jgi:hypothetical protein
MQTAKSFDIDTELFKSINLEENNPTVEQSLDRGYLLDTREDPLFEEKHLV